MALRINPDTSGDLLAALARTAKQENKALAELASGRRVNFISDDPAAASAMVINRSEVRAMDQFLRNVTGLRALLQIADSALNSVVLAMTRVIQLGVEGANGTLTPDNRLAVAAEVQGLQEQLLSLANLTFQGKFVFAGTAITTQPFVLDGGVPSGVRYDGNANVTTVEIANGETIEMNLPGDAIFSDPTADLFLAVNDLIVALQTSTGISAAVAGVEAAFDHVVLVRGFYGNALNRIDGTEFFLNRERLELNRQEEGLVGADLAETVTNLIGAQNARDAILAAASRISGNSLLDFLR